MDTAFAEWRNLAGEHLGLGRGRRYPAQLKRSAVALARRGLAAGMTMEAVGRTLGVPTVTLSGWLDVATPVPVKVLAPTATHVRLELGRGHVDLTMAELGALIWGP